MSPMQHPILATVCLSVAVFAAGCSGATPTLPDTGDVEAVDIALEALGDRQKEASADSKDNQRIEALLSVLRQGQQTSDHKCGDSGTITLRTKRGTAIKLGILAGHKASYYEYRFYSGSRYTIFRVDRVAFLKAMTDLGMAELDSGFPE